MVTFNISGLDEVRERLNRLNPDELCHKVATGIKDDIHRRIHVAGEAADGSPIGTYSEGYMKVRTGNYSDAKKLTKGPRKGKPEDKKTGGQAGVFTRGPKKGTPRPVYNRNTEKKVILSLSSDMEQDFLGTPPIPVEGGYGIGFRKEENYNKAIWNEERYGKTIYGISDDEKQKIGEIVHGYIEGLGN